MIPSNSPIPAWHGIVRTRDLAALSALLADDAVFHSPVVHAPQRGRPLVLGYLGAALQVLGSESFRYVREIEGARDAVLEFEVDLDGVIVNGVDLIRWDEQGRIVDFKVMIRPMKAIERVRERMAAMLEAHARRG